MGNLEDNLFAATYKFLIRCLTMASAVIVMILIISVLELYYPHLSNGSLIGGSIGWAFLAYYVHVEFLLPVERDRAEDFKRVGGFIWRSILLTLFAVIPGVLVGIVIIETVPGGSDSELVVFLSLVGSIWISHAIIMSVFGTILPAHITEVGTGILAALNRYRGQFTYTFLRLLFVVSPLLLISALVLIIPVLFGYSPELVLDNGRFNHMAITAHIAGLIVTAYAMVMNSVILSRAYMRAEIAGHSQGS